MKKTPWRRAKLTIAAMLCGGSAFTSCDTRMKAAVLNGVEDFVFFLLSPDRILAQDAATDNTEP